MKHIGIKSLTLLVEKKPILLLNKTALGLSFVDVLIHRSADSIATQKDKRLPLEIWLMVLDFAVCDKDADKFCLVQPQFIIDNGRFLLCKRVWQKRGKLCGRLEDRESVIDYEFCLQWPRKQRPEDLPFDIPATNDDKHTVKVEIATLKSSKSTRPLFSAITVPDIISWLEYGDCLLCNAVRVICPGCSGGRYEEFIFDEHLGCGMNIPCPLCMGIDFTEEYLDECRSEHGDDGENREADEEFDKWYQGRFVELG